MEDFAPGTYTFLHTYILYYFSLLVIKPETIEFYQKVEGLRWPWKNLIMGTTVEYFYKWINNIVRLSEGQETKGLFWS